MIYVNTYLKHLFCLSLTAVLLLGGQACKKTAAGAPRIEFRDSFIGRYYCEKHDTHTGYSTTYDSSGQPHYIHYNSDTLIGYDTVTVSKIASDTNALSIGGILFTVTSRSATAVGLRSDASYYPLGGSIVADTLYAQYSNQYIGLANEYTSYYKGIKIH
ncbi:MAG: hypothetical protein JST90_15695 [Bacteroidetes bacterium]|nr:hypothetical protein [Bacteroidota bacterium]